MTYLPPTKVIVWGTGAVGREMITTIIDHRPDLQIVGARVYSDDKDGADVGTLVGRNPIGVAASTDVGKILATRADCVLYTPRHTSIDDVCALLASGKNVATTAFLFHPRRIAPSDTERVLDACRRGESSVHGSGLNPGNLSGVLPLALSGMSRTIDKITVQERADWSVYESTSITFDGMAFGRPVDARPLLLPGQLRPRGRHRGARPLGERGHRHAGSQRGAAGVRRACGLRDDGRRTSDPQPHRLRQRSEARYALIGDDVVIWRRPPIRFSSRGALI